MGGFRARSGSLLGASGLRRVDRELPQPFAQRVAVDAEPPCGFELVAAHFAQGAAEQSRFDDFLKPGVEIAVTPPQLHLHTVIDAARDNYYPLADACPVSPLAHHPPDR